MNGIKNFLVIISFLGSFNDAHARYDHVCAYTNESVVKFRKKHIAPKISLSKAYDICVSRELIGDKVILFSWPVDLCNFWMSSLFGPRTFKGVTKHHGGIDLAASKGTSVVAAAPGVVTKAERDVAGYGTLVEIKHKHGFVTRYGHLDTISVSVGDKVAREEEIGQVGLTGNVRGKKDPSHLHFEILLFNKKVDPLQYLYCSEVSIELE